MKLELNAVKFLLDFGIGLVDSLLKTSLSLRGVSRIIFINKEGT